MLSRLAESLYWVGRYVERADDMARLLDVHLHRIMEEPDVDEPAACEAVLRVMGRPSPESPLDAGELARLLALDLSHPCSIAGAMAAARENARGAREILSLEMWECLNVTYNELLVPVGVSMLDLHGFFRRMRDRTMVLTGLADSTMTRDDGWRFLVLGRSLERVDMTTRLLLARLTDVTGPAEWVTTLRSCSAHDAYLRTYRRGVEPALVTEFLLLDRLFPRSAYFALVTAEGCLTELTPPTGRTGPGDEAQRVLGRARHQLEYLRPSEIMDDLPRRLHELQAACAEAGAAVARRFFQQSAAVTWQVERAAERA